MSTGKNELKVEEIIKRKKEHLDICLNKPVDMNCSGFNDLRLSCLSIPDSKIQVDTLDTSCSLFSRRFFYPIMISGMVGGIPKAHRINLSLIQLAQAYNIPMGVGSQKIALLYPETRKYFDFSSLGFSSSSSSYPFLISNIGMDLLSSKDKKDSLDLCHQAVDMIQAQALSIHLNLLQELIQPEGTRSFDGILDKIIYIKDHLGLPLIVKEVGMGMSSPTIKTLIDSGIEYIDIGGKGGTSWAYIESLRTSNNKDLDPYLPFINEGYSTVESIRNYTEIYSSYTATPNSKCIATGGIRSGVDIFKALSLGASICGIGLGFLKHCVSIDSLTNYMESLIRSLKISMILTGTCSIKNIDSTKIQ